MAKITRNQEAAGNDQNSVRTGQIYPQFIRLPRSGHQCPHTGLSRAKLNQLILPCPENGRKPPVKSICLGPAGKKGVRLIEYKSLINFLRGYLGEESVKANGKEEAA